MMHYNTFLNIIIFIFYLYTRIKKKKKSHMITTNTHNTLILNRSSISVTPIIYGTSITLTLVLKVFHFIIF